MTMRAMAAACAGHNNARIPGGVVLPPGASGETTGSQQDDGNATTARATARARGRRGLLRRVAALAAAVPVVGLAAGAAPANAASHYWGAIVDGKAPSTAAFAPGGAYYEY